MGIEATADVWWKNAVIYCLDVETFLDLDGDGTGDLGGLMDRIDYLAGLGVTCIWLMPFYPTPNRDDGYDVCDHFDVDERLGNLTQLVQTIRLARDRGIRVIADLVVNHTSDQHPWFQAARADPDSPFRDYYVWRDEPTDEFDRVIFPGEEQSNWDFDDAAGQFFLHRFYRHQPDLNIGNPAVRREITNVVDFWLQQGLAGFRVDAVPHLLDPGGLPEPLGIDPHDLLADLQRFVGRRRGDAILLGEVNLPPAAQRAYFGDQGDELHLVFNFHVNQHLWLALARQRAEPLRRALAELPAIPADCQWANFIRIHDELNVGRLDDAERREVFEAFGPEARTQIFGRGLRRRLAPMLADDEARVRLANSLLFSLPGTPVVYYGEELGMGENLDLPGRHAVRSPMQWKPDPSGGFSRLTPEELRRPPPQGHYGPERVNVAGQRGDPDSLLNFFERLIRHRRETPELGWGHWDLLDTDHPAVLAHRCVWEGRTVVVVHNLADESCAVTIDLGPDAEVDVERVVGERVAAEPAPPGLAVRLERYGFGWFRLESPLERHPA